MHGQSGRWHDHKAASGDRVVVVVGGADTIQQCIRAGLLDELHVDIRPVLLGGGLRLFSQTDTESIELEKTRVIDTPNVIQLVFRVVK